VCVGSTVGVFVGSSVGVLVGSIVGVFVGSSVGVFVGSSVGVLVGSNVGVFVGSSVGVWLGNGVIGVARGEKGGCSTIWAGSGVSTTGTLVADVPPIAQSATIKETSAQLAPAKRTRPDAITGHHCEGTNRLPLQA
jgi:hypothetical protein